MTALSELQRVLEDDAVPSAAGLLAARQRVEMAVHATQTRSHGGRSRRRVALVISLGLVTAGAGTAAGVALTSSSRPVIDHSSARCYTRADLGSGGTFPGTTVGVATRQPAAGGLAPAGEVADALAACAALWRQGFLTLGASSVSTPSPSVADATVPALVSCTLSDGTAAVFPGGADTCLTLGLAPTG
jgi:hypothetical protein